MKLNLFLTWQCKDLFQLNMHALGMLQGTTIQIKFSQRKVKQQTAVGTHFGNRQYPHDLITDVVIFGMSCALALFSALPLYQKGIGSRGSITLNKFPDFTWLPLP